MRILITGCTYFPSRNGQAIFTINLAEGLAAQGHKVLVVIPKLIETPLLSERKGVKIIQTPALDLSLLHSESAMSLFPLREVRKILKEFKPEIVHVHDHYPLSRTFVTEARKNHIKVVGTNHFVPDNLSPYIPGYKFSKSFFNSVMWKWMLSTFNLLNFATAPSRTAAELLRNQKIKLPVYPISCGVDTERFISDPAINKSIWREKYKLDPEKPLFLFVGRVDAEKKIEVLINALKIRNADDIQLVVAGTGANKKYLEEMVEHLGLANQVKFPGFIPDEDLPALLNAIDIFAMPSEAELLSIASLEAMACAKPLLLANARALPELIHNGKNGYLFEPGSPEDAARKIDMFISQKDCWMDMGQESLNMVQTHTLSNTIAGYSMLYEALLSNARLPNPQTEWLAIRPGGAGFKRSLSAN
jgi:1,2-diacylglycerol 3-alpha-glucosyltransferase